MTDSANPLINRQWTVAARPDGALQRQDFGYKEVALRSPDAGEVLLETHLLNIAPVMRMYMQQGSTAGEPELAIGDVIHGRGVAKVLESRHPDYAPGDFVQGQLGWQTHKLSRMSVAEKFRPLGKHGLPIHYALSVFGITGFSAYCGFVTRGEPKKGDAVLISGAAGGVGSLVVQMAKVLGCGPIIGIAGGAQKCALVEQLGCDASIDYQAEDVAGRLGDLLPNGIDVYFDNVGGEILEAAIDQLANNARIVLCGSISEYQRNEPFGPRNYTKLRATNSDLRGFFVYNHTDEFDEAEQVMAQWVRDDALDAVFDELEGFESMPEALMGMYSGTAGGKRLVNLFPGEMAVS